MESTTKSQIPLSHESHGHDQDVQLNIVLIDVEFHCQNELPHPHHDSGVVLVYLIRVDGSEYRVEHPTIKGRELIALVGKGFEDFDLFQKKRKHGQIYLEPIGKDEKVDLRAEGIESFETKPKTYRFLIAKKDYVSPKRYITVREILADYARVDVSISTLATAQQHEYTNQDEVIDLVCVNEFVVFNNEPTSVS